MKRKIAGLIMLIAGLIFVLYAISHPEASFPFSNYITYTIYFGYLCLMIYLLFKPVKKQ